MGVLTKEQQREKSRRYRAKYPEKMRAYDRQRRLRNKFKNRPKIFGDKQCRMCGIYLRSEFAALSENVKWTRVHCRGCCEKSKKHIQRENMRKWRSRDPQKRSVEAGRESMRRFYAKLKADPVAHAAYLAKVKKWRLAAKERKNERERIKREQKIVPRTASPFQVAIDLEPRARDTVY